MLGPSLSKYPRMVAVRDADVQKLVLYEYFSGSSLKEAFGFQLKLNAKMKFGEPESGHDIRERKIFVGDLRFLITRHRARSMKLPRNTTSKHGHAAAGTTQFAGNILPHPARQA